MSEEVLIKVENVSKKFCRKLKRSLWYGIKDVAGEVTGQQGDQNDLRPDEFWALKNVNFELKKGQCLGLIGGNGAGKTTLLRILNGLIKPDSGKIKMKGRVGALIALGAGFNPVLTGRENIYVNASILGLSTKEITKNLDEIIEFADLAEFIDSPVQSYSSGMAVRLGFAISTTLKPDILLLDEVLAVGDASFRHKCYNRLSSLMKDAAVIIVSHSMDYIAHISNTVAVMKKGSFRIYENPTMGIASYNQENLPLQSNPSDKQGKIEIVYPPIQSVKVEIVNSKIKYTGSLNIEVIIDSSETINDVVFSFVAVNQKEQPVMCWHTSRYAKPLNLHKGTQKLNFSITPVLLHDGQYTWNFNMAPKGNIEHKIWFMRAGSFTITSDFRPLGDIPYIVNIPDSSVTLQIN